MKLENSIIRTLIYFDMFDYALTLSELKRYLWKYPVHSTSELYTAIQQSDYIEEHNGLYTLAGRGEIAELRNERYLQTERKFQKRRWIFWLLSLLPHVQAIFIVNSLAIHNAKDSSDIDLLIITDPNRIWTARLFTTALVKLLGVRPRDGYTKDTVCLSFYMDTTVLAMEELVDGPDDVYQIYWLKQLVPLYDPANIRDILAEKNAWVHKFLPNANSIAPHPERWISHSWLHTLAHTVSHIGITLASFVLPIERMVKWFQYKIMPTNLAELSQADHNRVVVLSDHMLKLHTHDPRPAWKQRWHATTKRYLPTSEY